MSSYTLLVEELKALAPTAPAHARVLQCAVPTGAVGMTAVRAFDGTSSNRADGAAVTMSGTTTSVPILGTHRKEREPREGGL